MSKLENEYKFFYISFYIIVFANIIYFYTYFINSSVSRIFDFLLGSHIFLSIFFLIHKFNFKNFFYKKNLYALLLIYSLAQLLRPPADNYEIIINNYWFSKFGGVLFDTIFLLPFFYLWSYFRDSIYWFEKISLLSIKIGIILFPLCYYYDVEYFWAAFYPIYYLLIGYNYSNTKRKIWIILGFLISNYIFIIENYRSGIVKNLLVILTLIILSMKLKKMNKILLNLLFFFPILLIILFFLNDQFNFYYFLKEIFFLPENFTVDTRTFIYRDLISHFKSSGNLFFGDGGFGNYYSIYFDNWRNVLGYSSGDNMFRPGAEVGILNIILKGGIILFLLICLIVIKSINFSYDNSKNAYIYKLSFVVAIYFMFMSIENIYIFNLNTISFWILIGIISNDKLTALKENDIKTIFKKL